MTKEKEEKEKVKWFFEEDDEPTRLCPECEGRGFVKDPETGRRDICMTCDGLGVVYD